MAKRQRQMSKVVARALRSPSIVHEQPDDPPPSGRVEVPPVAPVPDPGSLLPLPVPPLAPPEPCAPPFPLPAVPPIERASELPAPLGASLEGRWSARASAPPPSAQLASWIGLPPSEATLPPSVAPPTWVR